MNKKPIAFLLLFWSTLPATGLSAPAIAAAAGQPQQQRPESRLEDDKGLKEVLHSLVVEVRLLRQQFERMAQSQQAQLLLDQIQFQEGKVERLERQLQETRDSVANAERQLQQNQISLQQLSKQLEQETDPSARSNLDIVRENIRGEIANNRRDVQRLQQRETDLGQKLSETQTTLDGLYQRLEAAEKEMRKPPER
jgi:predicted  nucleic acid-binding Zn-ribbon protein